ncbi:MAG: hypothetical protein Q4F54_05220 [Coriobacteriia bacterium]|nr:hypothetical protein [Coriobacteriia bacterium]
MAHHIKGTVTDKVSTDPIKDMTVTATANKAVPIAPSKMVVTDTTTGEGKYDIKLYEGADCTVQVGDKTHIEQSQSLVLGTEDYTLDFSLDKGYTFIPKDYDDSSST